MTEFACSERVRPAALDVVISRAQRLAYLVCTEQLLHSRAKTIEDVNLIEFPLGGMAPERCELDRRSSTVEQFGTVVIGGGTGNQLVPASGFGGGRTAIVERSLLGGTCLNRGCIPSKMLVRTAAVAEAVRDADAFGVKATLHGVDWSAVHDRIWGHLDPIPASAVEHRRSHPDVELIQGSARFVDHKVIEVDGRTITADRFVLAAGARTWIPNVPGLADVAFDTSDTIMRVPSLPRRLVILGAGFIAAELGHVMAALGVEVTIIGRQAALLTREDAEVASLFTEQAATWANLVLGAKVERVTESPAGIQVELEAGGTRQIVEGDRLLVATGRVPNSDELNVEATGVALDALGYVVVDRYLRTNVEGIWALGDISNSLQLKHCANLERRVLSHNLLSPGDEKEVPIRDMPHAVFTSPEIAAVGLTEAAAAGSGVPFVVGRRAYSGVAYGWALGCPPGFAKVIVNAEDRTLLGAHVIGEQASTVIQPLVQGINLGTTVDELAHGVTYIHPALSEVVENALLEAIDALDGPVP